MYTLDELSWKCEQILPGKGKSGDEKETEGVVWGGAGLKAVTTTLQMTLVNCAPPSMTSNTFTCYIIYLLWSLLFVTLCDS
jgi:hypothetical protein